MANSVVKVTDAMLNDSLLLLVGEDGTVTPDRETVESYLSAKGGETNIQLMQINKSDKKSIEVTIDNLTYVPDKKQDDMNENVKINIEEQIARNLHNFKLDHDYTPLTSPKRPEPQAIEEVDELAKTLELLDGGAEPEDIPPPVLEPQKPLEPIKTKVVPKTAPVLTPVAPPPLETPLELPPEKPKAKVITPTAKKTKAVTPPAKQKPKIIEDIVEDFSDEEDESDEEADEDFTLAYEDNDDENDSDFEPDDTQKNKGKKSRKSRATPKSTKTTPEKLEAKPEIKAPLIEEKPPTKPTVEEAETTKPESPDKKHKKEKKPPKPIPDDFALFSTPDIIRRVGGKDPQTPTTPEAQPAKIHQENRSKSTSSEQSQPSSPVKHRHSLDSKRVAPKSPVKDRRPSLEKPKRHPDGRRHSESSKGQAPAIESNEISSSDHVDPGGINLEASLDLDQTLLDNINSDLISEDLLYQVAQSLVGNTDLQNAIDKGLNDGMLDPSISQSVQEPQMTQEAPEGETEAEMAQRGMQIVRPDGRIVVIPPIERPTTRSRNKRKEDSKPIKKPTHKPLDNEHVSGNELDSSEDEEESEDDPNKLWCICNQPHNNRFMICCDTCEEWYHGKCVNITKTMGQQMEAEGKEWICLFCKDTSLKRPQAAARRIRKASRASRASTDSAGSSKKSESPSVDCVVCQKPARKNSIFCSEACILAHAQGVERVVVFERSTGNMLTGNKAPVAANLDQWLKQHPGYEVVRSGGKIVTAKSQVPNLTQSRLKLVKNADNDGVSLAIHKRGIKVGVMKHAPKHPQQSPQQHPQQQQVQRTPVKTPVQMKIVSRKELINQPKAKLIPHQIAKVTTPTSTPKTTTTPKVVTPTSTPKAKVIQTKIKLSTPSTPSIQKEKEKQTPTKDRPTPVKTPKARQAEQAVSAVPKQQENIRENVQKTLFEQLTNRLKISEGDLKLSEEEVKSISVEIESQLYKCFGDTGQKYRNKYRSLIFNIKDVKNQTLWRRICEKSINPYQLVRLSPDDLASQELARWREQEAKHQLDMIKKSELELLNCNRQYVLKTHKGEQVLEDNRPTDKIDNTEVITSLTEGPLSDDFKNDKDRKKSSKHSHRETERKSRRDRSEDRSHHKHSRDRSKRSKKDDRKRSRSRDRERHRKSSHKSSRHKKDVSTTDKLDKKSKEILEQLVDNKIVPPLEDRLWKHVQQDDIVPAVAESDSDHEPTSTVTIPTPPRHSDSDEFQTSEGKETMDKARESLGMSPLRTSSGELWRGTINMIDVAQISISAHEVSGDCSLLGNELPKNLDIVGRISPETVWDYIGKMKCSNSKMISLVRLNAINVEEKMPYLALYSYLSSRNRLGVVKSPNKAVKDFYVLPLAPQKPIPQALLPISGPGFEESRPALLLGIIVRDKRKRVIVDTAVPPVVLPKKTRIETPPLPPVVPEAVLPPLPPSRSYTPPPANKDPRKLPLPPETKLDDGDEPYSPEDSDPDNSATMPTPPIIAPVPPPDYTPAPLVPPYPPPPYPSEIPVLPPTPVLPASTLEIQRQMEELNKKIEMQKSEINSISKNIVTASSEIGSTALASIALPSNLQQILDSIKSIGNDSNESEPPPPPSQPDSNLTIPLILPNKFSRPLAQPPQPLDSPTDTIPLNLPKIGKLKQKGMNSPQKSESVLSSLTEDDLIRKAAEMLGESQPEKKEALEGDAPTVEILDSPSESPKRTKYEYDRIPGLDAEI